MGWEQRWNSAGGWMWGEWWGTDGFQGCSYFLAPTTGVDVDVLICPKKNTGGEVGKGKYELGFVLAGYSRRISLPSVVQQEISLFIPHIQNICRLMWSGVVLHSVRNPHFSYLVISYVWLLFPRSPCELFGCWYFDTTSILWSAGRKKWRKKRAFFPFRTLPRSCTYDFCLYPCDV